MTFRHNLTWLGVLASLLCFIAGSIAASPEKSAGPTEKKASGKASTETVAALKADTSESKAPIDSGAKQPAKPVDTANAKREPKQHVLLGSGDLLTGIPGKGPLKTDAIRKWLADPKNHEVLEVELPLGLDAGTKQIQGLDTNPLTRAKIELGRQLYFDKRLSKGATVSCASCHSPGHGFAANTRFGVGIEGQLGGRNSPVAYNRILSGKQFWDGRAGSLEDQAIGPIANPIEMGNSHDGCVKCLKGLEGYVIQFERIFGEVKIENVAMAIASFERALVTGPAPFDYAERLRPYEAADLDQLKEDDAEAYAQYEKLKAEAAKHPMSASAKRGREIFFTDKGGCTACHVGPNLSDELYHNLGIGMEAATPDLGRFVVTKVAADRGAFKTPTIRNVELTAPYMHDGSQKSLDEVVDWYAKGGHPNPNLSKRIKKLTLTVTDKEDLVAFMKACTSSLPKVEEGRLPE